MKFMQKTLFAVLPCVMFYVLPTSALATQEFTEMNQSLPLNYDANDDYFQQFDNQDNYQYVQVISQTLDTAIDNLEYQTSIQPEVDVAFPVLGYQPAVEQPTLLDKVLPAGFEHQVAIEPVQTQESIIKVENDLPEGFEHRVAIEPAKTETTVNKPVVAKTQTKTQKQIQVKTEKTVTSTQNSIKVDISKPAKSSNQVDNLIAKAKKMLGVPYHFGGTSPKTGFDCSGFMQYVFKDTISLPRTSSDMAQVGKKVSRSDLKAGDMVFFAHSGSRISHVGMYLGAGQFIHSPSTGKTIEITSMDSKYWSGRFITARRVVES